MNDSVPENPQKQHYTSIHDEYAKHYYDEMAMAYRRRFLLSELCKDLDLNGKRIADLACGSGHNSLVLQEMYPDVALHGFDLSAKACAEYRKIVNAPATECDLIENVPGDSEFDVAMIIGGLHHCVANLDAALNNCARLIKPGGVMLAVEPNQAYLFNLARRVWYRSDRWFDADTEAPLDLDDVTNRLAGKMVLEHSRFLGGPAYFIILNSLILRIPLRLKSRLGGILFPLEAAYNRLPGRLMFPAFICRWRKL